MNKEITEAGKESNSDHVCHFTVLQGDVGKQHIEAIALVIPHHLEIKGALNTSVFEQAGSELDTYILENIVTPKPGDVFMTSGFNLPAKNIIFAVIPSWRSDLDVLDKHIKVAIQSIFGIAKEQKISGIALPPLCLGKIGYKPERGIRLMLDAMFTAIDPRSIHEVRFVSDTPEHIRIYKEKLQRRLSR